MAPGTTAGVPTGLLPVPEGVQLLGAVLGGRQHVQVALLLTEPAGVLREEDRGRQGLSGADGGRRGPTGASPHRWETVGLVITGESDSSWPE